MGAGSNSSCPEVSNSLLPPSAPNSPAPKPPPRFSFCGFIDPCSASNSPPPHPPGFSPIPFLVSFSEQKPWTAARSPLPTRESAETDPRVISGPERQLAREAPLEVSGFVSHWCHFFPAWLSLRQRKASSWGSSILAVSLQKSQ